MGKRYAAAFIALVASAGPAPAAVRSIVGTWARTPADCATQFAYKVGPRSLVSDELSCSFGGVSRAGAIVRFEGRCDDGTGARPETLVAAESSGRLSLRFEVGGGSLDGLVRCQAGSR